VTTKFTKLIDNDNDEIVVNLIVIIVSQVLEYLVSFL